MCVASVQGVPLHYAGCCGLFATQAHVDDTVLTSRTWLDGRVDADAGFVQQEGGKGGKGGKGTASDKKKRAPQSRSSRAGLQVKIPHTCIRCQLDAFDFSEAPISNLLTASPGHAVPRGPYPPPPQGACLSPRACRRHLRRLHGCHLRVPLRRGAARPATLSCHGVRRSISRLLTCFTRPAGS